VVCCVSSSCIFKTRKRNKVTSDRNIEHGDYITSSDFLGYGEKQDDDLLHNYTVGKATMDCNFELESPYYNCFEIDDLDIITNDEYVMIIIY
jgi:hypothetical protein